MSPKSTPRIPYLSEEPDDPQVKAVFDRLRQRWQGAPVLHLYRVIGWAAGLVGPWLDFSHALRFRVTPSAALRELMVVRSGQLAGAEYEWKHHWVLAREAGVSEDKLNALGQWHNSSLFDQAERAVLALADDTSLGVGASAETMGELSSLFGNREVVELVMTAGFYAGVSRIINSLAIPIEADFESMAPRDD